ncbi:LacI family DNA-binding transcriptional regulator [Enterobacter hormaechei]|uniref:LacI family DNA-binding transcriptional regulator n=1 Tax=Enterobacter hormaechei TaxID=158836 RepID=UPI001D00911B|nr:LacI family DNA-binding transcriptional regulator [Enterobacter hormaechei]
MKRKTFAAVTSQQVAQLAGVSQSAVSRTFTPGASISPATREKVLKAARELGYRPNAIARMRSPVRSTRLVRALSVSSFLTLITPFTRRCWRRWRKSWIR